MFTLRASSHIKPLVSNCLLVDTIDRQGRQRKKVFSAALDGHREMIGKGTFSMSDCYILDVSNTETHNAYGDSVNL